MLRLLHTSDWHLGAAFHDQERAEDEGHALDQIVALARAESVDVVIVAGDVFDSVNPPAAAQRRYFDCLRRFVAEAGVGSVIVIAGNHDNGLRLDGPRELLGQLNLHVRGQLLRGAPIDDCLVPLRRRGVDDVAAWCAAVPYLRDGDLDPVDAGAAAVEARERLARGLGQRFGALRDAAVRRAAGKPVVVAAHCFTTGSRLAGDERPLVAQVGQAGQVDANLVGEGAAYLALGHLHRPQTVGGHGHWRYSGSLLPMGFDETETPRQVLIADVSDDGPASVREVSLTSYRRYVRVTGKPADVAEAIAGLEAKRDDEPTPWLEAVLDLDGPSPGIARDVQVWAQQRGWAALATRRRRTEVAAIGQGGDEIAGLSDFDPVEVFRRLVTTAYPGQEPQADLLAAYEDLLARVRAES